MAVTKYAKKKVHEWTAACAPSDPTRHVCQRNVQEHSSRDGKDCIGGEIAPEQDSKHEADVTRHGRQQVEENGLRDAHPGIQQDYKVTCTTKHKRAVRVS